MNIFISQAINYQFLSLQFHTVQESLNIYPEMYIPMPILDPKTSESLGMAFGASTFSASSCQLILKQEVSKPHFEKMTLTPTCKKIQAAGGVLFPSEGVKVALFLEFPLFPIMEL